MGFLPSVAVVMRSHLAVGLFKQFLPEGLVSQIPTSAQSFPFLSGFLRATLFHVQLKLLPPGRTVFGNAHFTQEPIHTQPPGALRFQIKWITAPTVGAEL